MRIRVGNGREGLLGYCANVHPGESLASVLRAVRHFAAGVRTELGVDQLALGLWLSRTALSELEQRGTAELRTALHESGIFVGTLNGFPYGDFHADVVKRRVYHPDLGTSERRQYLLGLARVLSELLPTDLEEGTISTLPIGHRAELPTDAAQRGVRTHDDERKQRQDQAERAASQLCRLSEELAHLRERTGRSIRICLEPEPGCWLETTQDAIDFFCEQLPRVARRLGTDTSLLSQHLGVCYDTCHQAVCFESAEASLRALSQAGIRIGKAQLSSALEIADPSDVAARDELLRYAEPRFLHQVRARLDDGSLACADDLSEIAELPLDRAWRVHFHVPIHRAMLGGIRTTRSFLSEALPLLAALPNLPHFEVETYTWSVLPEAERPKTDADLVRGLSAELRWARGALV
jgi:hypothetical protein